MFNREPEDIKKKVIYKKKIKIFIFYKWLKEVITCRLHNNKKCDLNNLHQDSTGVL